MDIDRISRFLDREYQTLCCVPDEAVRDSAAEGYSLFRGNFDDDGIYKGSETDIAKHLDIIKELTRRLRAA